MSELQRKVFSIFAANAFGDVFLLGSRINHSCTSNNHSAYNTSFRKETFHHVRDIVAGEELAISYNDGTDRTKSQRQGELDKWGFVCTCPTYQITTEEREREARHALLFSLDEELAITMRTGNSKSWENALKLA